MIKTPELEKLCDELGRCLPNWDAIEMRWRACSLVGGQELKYLTEYIKEFSELHVDICLEELARNNSEFKIEFNPLPERQAGEYKFHYSASGRFFVRKKLDEKELNYEYDSIILVNRLPVIFEIKLQKWYTGRKRLGHNLNDALKPKYYNTKLKLIRLLFNSDIGYVVIVPKDIFQEKVTMQSYLVHNFISDNGLFLPFYTTRKSFREEVRQRLREWKVKFKDSCYF